MTEALSGAPAANLERAALLLVEPHRIPVVTAAELRRLRPGRIVVLGQTEAISAAVEQELLQFAPVVQRIGGVDRYETAVEVSRQRFPDGADVAFLAPGARPEDALGAVPVAIMSGGPVLFTHGHCVPATVVAELDRLDPTAIQILGSPDSVSDAVVRLERCAVSDQLTPSEPATPRSRR
jgi:putative cell wall-binding protein